MTLEEAHKQLEALGNEKMRAQNIRHGAGENHFGVRLVDVRKLAKSIKTNHELALALRETGNIDTPFWLPSEVEWEYACRAGTTKATYARPNSAEILGDIAW